MNLEKKKIGQRHSNKLQRLLDMESVAEKLETNRNETILNLSGLELTSDQVEILRLPLTWFGNKIEQFRDDGCCRGYLRPN